jgi:AbrB family looped-hinge helix DNA binding protein
MNMGTTKILVDNAKVMANGQITLPKDFRKALRIDTGDKVALIYDGEKVIMMNAMHYAMKTLQGEMCGVAEEIGLKSDDDVANLVMEMRYCDRDRA